MQITNFKQFILYCLLNPIDAFQIASRYFTMWCIFIYISIYLFYKFTNINLLKYINILLLASLVSITSIFIVYVYPKQISIDVQGGTFILKSPDLIFVDIVAHQLPFLIIIGLYFGFGFGFSKHTSVLTLTLMNTIVTECIILLYLLFNNIQKRYGIRYKDAIISTCIVIALNVGFAFALKM